METQNAQQKLVVKIATEKRAEVKRLRAAPQSYAELLDVMRDQMNLPQGNIAALNITYIDNAGDDVVVEDDQDLFEAYEFAAKQPVPSIKLNASTSNELVEKLQAMSIEEQQPASSDDESKEKVEALVQKNGFRKQFR
jgi:hypothetical protein